MLAGSPIVIAARCLTACRVRRRSLFGNWKAAYQMSGMAASAVRVLREVAMMPQSF
jgi:hypothetical protein